MRRLTGIISPRIFVILVVFVSIAAGFQCRAMCEVSDDPDRCISALDEQKDFEKEQKECRLRVTLLYGLAMSDCSGLSGTEYDQCQEQNDDFLRSMIFNYIFCPNVM